MAEFSVHRAAQEGQAGLLKSLLNATPSKINSIDADGRTPAHWLASTPHTSLLEWLVTQENPKANLELGDASGNTALIIATSAGIEANVLALLRAGAKIDGKNDKSMTALHYAASKGRVEIGKRLIQRGADINAKDSAQQTPLHRAATTGADGFLHILLNPPEPTDMIPPLPAGTKKVRCRLNGPDRLGNTPLHLAVESGHGSTAVLLIEAGADRDKPNLDDKTAEEGEGVGGDERMRVLKFIWGKVGKPDA